MLLFNYFFVHGSWHLLYGSGLYMLCAEKLKSKDNLSPARAPAKLGKKSMSIILIQNNSSLFILGQNRIIKYVSQINWLQPIIKSKLISINFMGFVYFSKWTWGSPHFTFTSVDAKSLHIYKLCSNQYLLRSFISEYASFLSQVSWPSPKMSVQIWPQTLLPFQALQMCLMWSFDNLEQYQKSWKCSSHSFS